MLKLKTIGFLLKLIKPNIIKGLALISLSLFLNSCSFFQYGFTNSVPDGCEVRMFRESDGTMHNYIIGPKCDDDKRKRLSNEKPYKYY